MFEGDVLDDVPVGFGGVFLVGPLLGLNCVTTCDRTRLCAV